MNPENIQMGQYLIRCAAAAAAMKTTFATAFTKSVASVIGKTLMRIVIFVAISVLVEGQALNEAWLAALQKLQG